MSKLTPVQVRENLEKNLTEYKTHLEKALAEADAAMTLEPSALSKELENSQRVKLARQKLETVIELIAALPAKAAVETVIKGSETTKGEDKKVDAHLAELTQAIEKKAKAKLEALKAEKIQIEETITYYKTKVEEEAKAKPEVKAEEAPKEPTAPKQTVVQSALEDNLKKAAALDRALQTATDNVSALEAKKIKAEEQATAKAQAEKLEAEKLNTEKGKSEALTNLFKPFATALDNHTQKLSAMRRNGTFTDSDNMIFFLKTLAVILSGVIPGLLIGAVLNYFGAFNSTGANKVAAMEGDLKNFEIQAETPQVGSSLKA